MGRGLGEAQKAILAGLREASGGGDLALTVAELAERLDRSQRQIRAAVRALEARELVIVRKGYQGWRGLGEYGKIKYIYSDKGWEERGKPKILETFTNRLGNEVRTYRAGMPVYGLWVWLPENRLARLRADCEHINEFSKALGSKAGPRTFPQYLDYELEKNWISEAEYRLIARIAKEA